MFHGRVVLLSAIIWAVIATNGCTTHESQKSNSQPQASRSETRCVAVSKVISQELHLESKLPSDLVAYRDVAISPKVPGFIEWIGVDRGSQVKKGDLLIRMSAPELPAQSKQGVDAATATADESTEAKEELDVVKEQLAAAQAKAKSSADSYQRMKGASEYPGIIAGNDLEVAQKTAEADAFNARSLEKKCKSLSSLQKAAANRHDAALQGALSHKAMESYLRLSAPFDGVITERNVHEGSFVTPPSNSTAQPLLRLKQLTVLRLVVPVPEADIGYIKPGAEMRFTVSAYPSEFFTGVVRRVADSVDINTRTMAVELDVTNSNRRLTPGMFAQVLWPVRRSSPSLFVPQSAIVKTTERTFVIRIKDGVAQWIDVKPGLSADDLQEVFGKLQPGDLVVVRGSDELRAGTQVSPQEHAATRSGS